MSVAQAIERSSHAFRDVVWPTMGPLLGGGHVIPVESVTDSAMSTALDTLAGVDLWYVANREVYPVASRVQYGRAWNTFTIRYSRRSGVATEYQKRVTSILSGSLYPRITIQAFIQGGQLLAAAAVDTKHLIQKATEYRGQVRVNGQDGASFIYVSWDQCDPAYIIKWEA